jgi:modulator of FtsH protease
VPIAYTADSWTDFGAAVVTAAAGLAGLLFIAVSINLRQILDVKSLPSRAAQTLILFATPLIAGVLLIVPGQARVALALELLATGLVIGGFQVYLDLTAERGDEDTLSRRMLGRVLPAIISCGCLVICGATLAGQAGGGLYWLVPSVLSAIVFGLINVWVLLVEILR